MNLKDPQFSKSWEQGGAVLQVVGGAGGSEAEDWAYMLFNLYIRWAESHGFPYQVVHESPGDTIGIRQGILEITGENAYGLLQGEIGVHRLVRISPHDPNGRRHASFASVMLSPLRSDDEPVKLLPKDLSWDRYKAMGELGNYADFGVRLTHNPSGFSSFCEVDQPEEQNREKALLHLQAKLFQKELERKISQEQPEKSWEEQIRNYTLHPYQSVKDLQTGVESEDFHSVLNGGIDGFIEAFVQLTA